MTFSANSFLNSSILNFPPTCNTSNRNQQNYTGFLERRGKVVTVSLNPAYSRDTEEQDCACKTFREWYEYCRFRLKNNRT